MAEMKYTVKDSVFSFIFKQPENTRQLYLALHPEDTEVTEEDCKLVTLEHVLTNGITNDLGFQVRDKLILLLEAQSKFSVNIALRMLLYLAATYKEYIDEQKLDLYGSKPVSIPRPELYMVYTRGPRQLPEVMRLSDMYDGLGGAEVEIKVLRGTGEGDISRPVYPILRDIRRPTDAVRLYHESGGGNPADLCGGKHFDAVSGIASKGGAGHYGDLVRSRARDGNPRVQLGSGRQAGGPQRGPRGRHPRHGAYPEGVHGGQSGHCPEVGKAI